MHHSVHPSAHRVSSCRPPGRLVLPTSSKLIPFSGTAKLPPPSFQTLFSPLRSSPGCAVLQTRRGRGERESVLGTVPWGEGHNSPPRQVSKGGELGSSSAPGTGMGPSKKTPVFSQGDSFVLGRAGEHSPESPCSSGDPLLPLPVLTLCLPGAHPS